MPKVLVAIDGSEHANRAFREAVGLFGKDAEYVMLSVVPPWSPATGIGIDADAGIPRGTATHGDAGTGMPYAPTPAGMEKVVQGVYDFFRDAQAQSQRIAGVRATGLIEEAKSSKRKIGKMVVDVAEEQGVDAIVVGAHGSSFVGGALLGSVSQFVIHNAHCPVVVSRDNS
ncbi:MAG: universal stress protein [Ilumatobacteraceae bacterium]